MNKIIGEIYATPQVVELTVITECGFASSAQGEAEEYKDGGSYTW